MHTKPRTHTHTGRRTHTGHGTLYWSPPPNPLVHSLRFTTDDECAAQLLLLLVEATLRRPIYPSCPFPPLHHSALLLPSLVTTVRQWHHSSLSCLVSLVSIASRKRANIHDIPDIVAIVAAVVIVSFRFVCAAFFFFFFSFFFMLSLLSLALLFYYFCFSLPFLRRTSICTFWHYRVHCKRVLINLRRVKKSLKLIEI